MLTPRGAYPHIRMRRLRSEGFIRRILSETHLCSSHLILPIFAVDQPSYEEEIAAMPQVFRLGHSQVLKLCGEAQALGIQAVALFPAVEAHLKSPSGKEAYNRQGLIPRLVRMICQNFPDLGVITDVALDPYTTHGHDGLVSGQGEVLGDATLEVLRRQALCHAEAGAAIVAPSDMMDGRVKVVRGALESSGFCHTKILCYSAKYASAFYGPFRWGIGAGEDLGPEGKKSYQLDPATRQQALREAAYDVDEGADMIMVKPAGSYLDILRDLKNQLGLPTFAYHVSGEYAMLKAAALQGWIQEPEAVLEVLLCCRRAGSDAILTYYAVQAARWLQERNQGA